MKNRKKTPDQVPKGELNVILEFINHLIAKLTF